MTLPPSPLDPPATPVVDGWPYRVERRVLAGIPCLLELPSEGAELRTLCIVYHGAWAAKEGKLGVWSALTRYGVAVVVSDAALHGERTGETPSGLNAREYVWESVRRTASEAPNLLSAALDLLGDLPVWVVGSSMGGYVAQAIAQQEGRVTQVAALITSGVWQDADVRRAEVAAFLGQFRPVQRADRVPPRRLLLISGDSDPVFPVAEHHQPTARAYAEAYAAAGVPDAFQDMILPGVGHYTSRGMRDRTIQFLCQALP